MTDLERRDTRMALLFELSLLISDSEQENFTKAEILDLIKTVAKAKEPE